MSADVFALSSRILVSTNICVNASTFRDITYAPLHHTFEFEHVLLAA